MSPVEGLTVRDLANARVAAERVKDEQGEAADHLRRRYDALAAALAATGSGQRRRDASVEPLIDEAARALATLQSPFAGYLEAPPAVIDLYQLHGAALADQVERTRALLTEFLLDAYTALWNLAPDASVPESVLDGLGPGPAPASTWSEWDDLPDDW